MCRFTLTVKVTSVTIRTFSIIILAIRNRVVDRITKFKLSAVVTNLVVINAD